MSRRVPIQLNYESSLAYLGGKRTLPLVKEEVWRDDAGNVIRYSLAYIDPLRFPGDNGRVLGYDNAHGHHHRHYCGVETPIKFMSYEKLVSRFEREVRKMRKSQ